MTKSETKKLVSKIVKLINKKDFEGYDVEDCVKKYLEMVLDNKPENLRNEIHGVEIKENAWIKACSDFSDWDRYNMQDLQSRIYYIIIADL